MAAIHAWHPPYIADIQVSAKKSHPWNVARHALVISVVVVATHSTIWNPPLEKQANEQAYRPFPLFFFWGKWPYDI